jgi:hypothetical protein
MPAKFVSNNLRDGLVDLTLASQGSFGVATQVRSANISYSKNNSQKNHKNPKDYIDDFLTILDNSGEVVICKYFRNVFRVFACLALDFKDKIVVRNGSYVA